MRKIRKGKKMLLILLIAVVAILAVVLIVNVVKNIIGEEPVDNTPTIIALPETTYSDMQVKNIALEYLKDNNETMVSMEIHNTTDKKVEDEHLTAILIGADENVLGQMPTWIQALEVGEQYKIKVILKGDLTATTQIKLVEK